MATKYSRGPRPSSQSCTEVSHCTNSPRQLRRDRHTCTSSTFRRFPRRNPAAISHCRSVSLLTSTACSLAKYSQASVGPKSRYFVFTSFSVRVRRLSGKRRFDTFPRSRCTTPRSPCSSIRTNNLRTSRSLIPKCPAASPCVKCPSCTSCNTFNRSRSFPLSISISWFRIRPVCRSSTGHFYFAEIGHSHFAATPPPVPLAPSGWRVYTRADWSYYSTDRVICVETRMEHWYDPSEPRRIRHSARAIARLDVGNLGFRIE